MNVKHEQFIGVYENAFSKEYCDSVIQYFENMVASGHAVNRQQQNQNVPKSAKDDLAVDASGSVVIDMKHSVNLLQNFNEVFWNQCYFDYANKYWVLREFSGHNSFAFRIQKTEPGQGYHMWHCETGGREICTRILAWTLYLNDVEEGGETEFIYQHVRVKPKTGTLVIWPSGFTHTHRGNSPLSGVKYIVTGWVEF
jgi:hypothetical protein